MRGYIVPGWFTEFWKVAPVGYAELDSSQLTYSVRRWCHVTLHLCVTVPILGAQANHWRCEMHWSGHCQAQIRNTSEDSACSLVTNDQLAVCPFARRSDLATPIRSISERPLFFPIGGWPHRDSQPPNGMTKRIPRNGCPRSIAQSNLIGNLPRSFHIAPERIQSGGLSVSGMDTG